jgi:DNA-binding SARP family transcriptional activator
MSAPAASPASLRFALLGGARLDAPGAPGAPGPIARLEKKTAALVALLAIDGATSRSRLAGLLWPESKESTARNNLAQAIRRLRTASGAALVVGDETVELSGATTDVAELLLAVHEGRNDDAVRLLATAGSGELLAGVDLDDHPDVDQWLRGARAQVVRAWSRAGSAAIDRAESDGRIDDALAIAERLVALEPLSEGAHLRVARLWLAKGDAPAATRAYERCRKTLAKELAMKPSAAMIEVLRAIREGRAPAPDRRVAPVALPAAVLRPRWVGRAKEWAELERAHAARTGLVVSAAPGVGKSRLLREFVERMGPATFVEGRPGDGDVPYASLARALRALLRERKPALAPWASAEIGRVVPELSSEVSGAPSMRSKLRFLEAVAHVVGLAVEGGLVAIVVDDLQWVDAASVEALVWVAERCWSGDIPAFFAFAHRDGDLPDETAKRVERMVSAGLARRIELGPLQTDEALELVRSLDLPALEGRLASIAEASHGVPLFLLEIVRSALDASGDDARVTIPDRVKALLRRRLDRLGEGALRLARTAAVAGPSFDLPLAAHVLGSSPLDLAEPWAALEAAQILEKGRLAHDTVGEVLRDDLPGVVREHVHARVAERLVVTGADPALVAHHFEAGARELDAAPYLMEAAATARGMSRVTEATRMFERAASAFERAERESDACAALYQLVRIATGGDAEVLAARLARLAKTDADRARYLCFRAGADVDQGKFAAADAAAVEAERLARVSSLPLVVAESLQVRLDVAIRSGMLDGVADKMDAFAAATAALDDPEGLAAAALYRAEIELTCDRPDAAVPHLDDALGHLERWGQLRYAKAWILAAKTRALLSLGDVEGAARAVDEADEALREASGATGGSSKARLARAELAVARGDAAAVRAALGDLPESPAHPRDVRLARVIRAEGRVLEGAHAEADADLAAIADDPAADARVRARAAIGRAHIARSLGTAAPADFLALVAKYGGPRQIEVAHRLVELAR